MVYGTSVVRQSQPVVIALAELLSDGDGGTEPKHTRPRKSRIRTRTRGRRVVKTQWDGPHAEARVACTRFREAGLWAFDTFNPNCGSRALDYLEVTAADACYFQEMKCRPEDLAQQAHTAAGQGWRLACGPARITDKGRGQLWSRCRGTGASRHSATLEIGGPRSRRVEVLRAMAGSCLQRRLASCQHIPP